MSDTPSGHPRPPRNAGRETIGNGATQLAEPPQPAPQPARQPSGPPDGNGPKKFSLPVLGEVSRRTAMKGMGATLGMGAFAAAISPIARYGKDLSLAEILQKHYKEMTDDDKRVIFARLEQEAKEQYGADVTISDHRPIPGVRFGYAINLSLCNGNGKCVEACHRENNHDRATKQSYIRVFEMPAGTMDFEYGNTAYTHDVPQEGKYYMPVQCLQCENPPCVSVCPVEATWQESDGIVVVDYNWCIGCRYCQAACPYHARRFNWKKPEIPAEEVNPVQSYLSNRIRPAGVVDKCHFCLHRTREGRLPACLEACPTGARIFGNLLDPESEIRWVLKNKRVFVLKEDLGTKPTLFYFFG